MDTNAQHDAKWSHNCSGTRRSAQRDLRSFLISLQAMASNIVYAKLNINIRWVCPLKQNLSRTKLSIWKKCTGCLQWKHVPQTTSRTRHIGSWKDQLEKEGLCFVWYVISFFQRAISATAIWHLLVCQVVHPVLHAVVATTDCWATTGQSCDVGTGKRNHRT